MKTLNSLVLVALPVLGTLGALGLLGGCAGPSGLGPKPTADAAGQRVVIEDDHVRIQELRLRGQAQRVTVSPKGGAGREYEILQPAAGKDLSQNRDATGQRVWPVLSF